MFIVIFILMSVCQSQADKIAARPGVDLPLAQKRLKTLNTIALVIGISSVVTSLFWIALSLRSRTKRQWNVVACVANASLLVWLLVNPMSVKISTSKAALGKPASSKLLPNRDKMALAPPANDRAPAQAGPQLRPDAAQPEVRPEPPQAPPDIAAPRQERRIIQEEEEEPKSTKLKKEATKQKQQDIDSDDQSKEEEAGINEDRLEGEVAQLVKKLRNKNPSERIKAAEALGDMGPDADRAREALCIAMTDARTAVRNAAASALAKIDPDLQKPALALLVDKELANCQQALRALAALGERGKPARSIVLAFPDRIQDASVRNNQAVLIIQTLMAIAPEDKRVFRLLASYLRSEDASTDHLLHIKLEAAKALPRTPFKKEAVRVLMQVFRSENDERLREASAQGLGEIGPDAKDAVKTLEAARFDPSARVREAVEAALKKIKPD
jgi:hypothetical protein